MKIEEGKYYSRENLEYNEKYIMFVIPRRKWTTEGIYKTETLAIHCDMKMWKNDWLEEYFQREATNDEIELFVNERQKHEIQLLGVGESMIGRRLNTLEDTLIAIEELSH